jgi:hypothetical protein
LTGGFAAGAVGSSDGGFLFGIFLCPLGNAPNFWKYEPQTADSFMR